MNESVSRWKGLKRAVRLSLSKRTAGTATRLVRAKRSISSAQGQVADLLTNSYAGLATRAALAKTKAFELTARSWESTKEAASAARRQTARTANTTVRALGQASQAVRTADLTTLVSRLTQISANAAASARATLRKRPTLRRCALSVAGLLFVMLFLLWGYSNPMIGFGGYVDTEGLHRPAKTFWDWLDLLAVPVVLGGGAFWLNRQARRIGLEISRQRSSAETLRTYLNIMTEFLLQRDLRSTANESEVASIARARTLATLRSIDGAHKGVLLRFLQESQLIHETGAVIDLTGADLEEAQLMQANLAQADLRETNLCNANLESANLNGAYLSMADLRSANLRHANLNGANLSMADLRNAVLNRAYLSGANLSRTDLRDASLIAAHMSGTYLRRANLVGTNLSEANLRGADLSEANLAQADLSGADLSGANLSGAELGGANLGGIKHTNHTVWPAGLTPVEDAEALPE